MVLFKYKVYVIILRLVSTVESKSGLIVYMMIISLLAAFKDGEDFQRRYTNCYPEDLKLRPCLFLTLISIQVFFFQEMLV